MSRRERVYKGIDCFFYGVGFKVGCSVGISLEILKGFSTCGGCWGFGGEVKSIKVVVLKLFRLAVPLTNWAIGHSSALGLQSYTLQTGSSLARIPQLSRKLSLTVCEPVC